MLQVGPNTQCALFKIDSLPMSLPASSSSSLLKVDARAVPHGKQLDGTPSKKVEPLIPFGPSLTLTEGTPNLPSFLVFQKSTPASSDIFSSTVNSSIKFSISSRVAILLESKQQVLIELSVSYRLNTLNWTLFLCIHNGSRILRDGGVGDWWGELGGLVGEDPKLTKQKDKFLPKVAI